MGENSKLALDDTVSADDDPFAIASDVADARRPAQSGTLSKLTRRTKEESLNEVIEIHTVTLR